MAQGWSWELNGRVVAEEGGSRTHRTRLTRPIGFEVRAAHRAPILFPASGRRLVPELRCIRGTRPSRRGRRIAPPSAAVECRPRSERTNRTVPMPERTDVVLNREGGDEGGGSSGAHRGLSRGCCDRASSAVSGTPAPDRTGRPGGYEGFSTLCRARTPARTNRPILASSSESSTCLACSRAWPPGRSGVRATGFSPSGSSTDAPDPTWRRSALRPIFTSQIVARIISGSPGPILDVAPLARSIGTSKPGPFSGRLAPPPEGPPPAAVDCERRT